ncbi:MAG: RNA-binding protein, partial [Microbacterium sp.]|nr:RNA-binding protein [Microbacterium sp.]
MVFTDDTEDALRAAVWLANSAEEPDTLVDVDDEKTFLAVFPYTGRID